MFSSRGCSSYLKGAHLQRCGRGRVRCANLDVSENEAPLFGVPITRAVLLRGLSWNPPFLEPPVKGFRVGNGGMIQPSSHSVQGLGLQQ